MALNIKTLGTRALTALVFVLVLLGSLLWNYYSFSVFFAIVAFMGLHEFFKLAEKLNAKPYKRMGFVSAAVVYLSFLEPLNFLYPLLVLIPFLIFINALFSEHENPIHDSLYTLGGLFYSVFPFALLHELVFKSSLLDTQTEYSPQLLFGVILLIWSNDTFAYLGGSLFGKHKMIERISPGKTWEGTIFGVAITIALGYGIGNYLNADKTLWLLLGFVVPVLATLGDLVESMIKRRAGVKDTGNIMPGHGGILDRFDSLIFVAPCVFAIVKLMPLLSVFG